MTVNVHRSLFGFKKLSIAGLLRRPDNSSASGRMTETIMEVRSAGNPHAAFYEDRVQVTASDDPVAGEKPTLNRLQAVFLVMPHSQNIYFPGT